MARAEQLSQLGDVHLESLMGGLRGPFVPERVDQAVASDDPVRVQEQEGNQRALFRAAELERAPFLEHLERAEDAEFHLLPPSRR